MDDRKVRKKIIAGKIKDEIIEDEMLKIYNRNKNERYIRFGFWLILLLLYMAILFFYYLNILDLVILPIILFIIYILIKPKKEYKMIYTLFEYFIGAGLILSDILVTAYTAVFIIYSLVFTHIYSMAGNIYSVISVFFIVPVGISLYTIFLYMHFSKIMDFFDEKIYSNFAILRSAFILILFLLSLILLILYWSFAFFHVFNTLVDL